MHGLLDDDESHSFSRPDTLSKPREGVLSGVARLCVAMNYSGEGYSSDAETNLGNQPAILRGALR